MRFISATNIGKELGIGYQKVNKVLAEKNLYNKETRRPTSIAFENGFAEIKTAVSRFHGKPVEFNVWNLSKLETLFPKQQKQEKTIIYLTSEDARDRICDSFSDFGYMLEIEPGTHSNAISKDAHYAVVQAYFSDPDYLRGTLLLHRFFHPDEAEIAKKLTLSLAYELFKVAVKIDAERAQSNLKNIEKIMSWLCKNAS